MRRCKRKVPLSLSEGPDRKRRLPIREAQNRRLTSSTASTEQVQKRGSLHKAEGRKSTLDWFQPTIQGQVQRKKSSFSKAGASKEYQAHTTLGAENISPDKPVPDLQELNASPGGISPVQKRPIQKTKPVPLQTSLTVQTTKTPGA
ncbi:hypothetical protein TNCV_4043621 [Trichonephila clavipes]|nr:hypothetical protein TNCV_4043621 [Trichonephila clavipes]